MTKRVLITGGAGFVGSALCERYLGEGWRVICLDNFITGSRENVQHLLKNEHFELVDHDVVFPYYIEVDLILNFACPASPIHYQSNPIKTVKTNVIGTMNMLGIAKKSGARFVQASTSEVYGDPSVHPQPETYWGNVNTMGERSCYDEGKRAGETLCYDYHKAHGVDIRVIRIFNTYGPRMALEDGRVVSNFIIQALKGQPISVYGDGSQTRSFCYVDDLVEGIFQISQQIKSIGPLNLGNDGEFSVLELAKKVLQLTGSPSKIIFKPLPQDDPKVRRPDLTKTKSIINWSPTISLEQGLKKTIPYFKNKLIQLGSL